MPAGGPQATTDTSPSSTGFSPISRHERRPEPAHRRRLRARRAQPVRAGRRDAVGANRGPSGAPHGGAAARPRLGAANRSPACCRRGAASSAIWRATTASTSNPFQGLRAPRSAKTLPKALSPDEAAQLLQPADSDDPMALRDRAMFELFYSSGLRLSELTGATLDNLDLEQQTVRVTGKGNKTRVVPIGSFAVSALREWLPQRATLAPAGVQTRVREQHRPAGEPPHRAASPQAVGAEAGPVPAGAPAHAAPFVRVAPAAVERRPARGAGDARACEHLDDTGVYASGLPAPREGLRRRASSSEETDWPPRRQAAKKGACAQGSS